MVVIHVPVFATSLPKADVLLRIIVGGKWKVEGRMPEADALVLAADCRKLGLIAEVMA